MSHESADVRERSERHLRALASLLELRFPHTAGRQRRVCDIAALIGRALRLSPESMDALSVAAQFHDIGMLAISDSLIMLATPFVRQHRDILRLHTDAGGRMVATLLPELPEAAEAIWWHHERPDRGGPYGLHRDEIPVLASIIALADAIEAMAHFRPHSPARTPNEIFAEVERNKGLQFEPDLVDIFQVRAKDILALAYGPRPVVRQGAPQAIAKTSLPAASIPQPGACPTTPETMSSDSVIQQQRTVDALEPIITKNEIIRIITDGMELRPLGGTVQDVVRITSSAQCTVEEVADAVGRDQALAMRVLRMANSAVYARGKIINNLPTAVQRIGITEIRNVALTLGVVHQYQGRLSQFVDPWLFWEHSIACGLLAHAIGKQCSGASRDNLFLWGVLHDLGRLILLDHAAEAYTRVLETAESIERPIEVIERKMLLVDHCEILARALEHWGFPSQFAAPVANHHGSLAQLERLGQAHARDAAIVALADRLAHAMMLGSSSNDALYPLDELVEFVGLDPKALGPALGFVPQQVEEMRLGLLARTNSDARPSAVERVRLLFSSEPQALCVSICERSDPVRMFFDHLRPARSVEKTPNVGIIYARDVREMDALFDAYESKEAAAGAGRLPVLVVLAKGSISEKQAWVRVRDAVVVRAPVPFRTLAGSVSRLLSANQAAKPAEASAS